MQYYQLNGNDKEELLTKILSADELRDSTKQKELYKVELKKWIDVINRKITSAKENNLTKTAFIIHSNYIEDVKSMYRLKGYEFILNDDNIEEICW